MAVLLIRVYGSNWISAEQDYCRPFESCTSVIQGQSVPAIIEWRRVRWNGQPTTGPRDLLDRCCRSQKQQAFSVYQSTASGMTLPGGQVESVLQIRAADADPDSYQFLDTEPRFKIEVEGCYCSVLDECWITEFKVRPRIVQACEAIPDNQRW